MANETTCAYISTPTQGSSEIQKELGEIMDALEAKGFKRWLFAITAEVKAPESTEEKPTEAAEALVENQEAQEPKEPKEDAEEKPEKPKPEAKTKKEKKRMVVCPPTANKQIFSLGQSIAKMAEAHVVIMCPNWFKANNCVAEQFIAKKYSLPIFYAKKTNNGWIFLKDQVGA